MSEVKNTEVTEEMKDNVLAMLETVKGFGERDLDGKEAFSDQTKKIGFKIRENITHRSEMLSAPMKDIMQNSEDGGEVSTNLLALRGNMESVNPNNHSLVDGGLRKLLSKLPGVGTKLEAWWAQYQSVSKVIDDIYSNLERGRDTLEKDNKTLKADKNALRKIIFILTDKISETMFFDDELVKLIESGGLEDQKYVEEDILYHLRQEITDMQMSLGAANQAIMVAEIIIKGNTELIRTTNRTLNLAKIALESAAGMEIALRHQGNQLKATQAANETITSMMQSTAKKAKTQGVEIIKQASDVTAQIEGMKLAFNDSIEAFNLLDTYKKEALPAMKESIESLDVINKEMAGHVERVA